MWFDNPTRDSRRWSRNRARSQRKLIFAVNTRLKSGKTRWVPHAGAVALVLAAIGAALLLCGFAARRTVEVLLTKNADYALTNLVVRCESPDLADYVVRRSSVAMGTNLFQVPIASIQAELGQMPRVKSVSVRRGLPHALEIAVSERLPLARLGNPEDLPRNLVIDDEGVVFFPRSRYQSTMPVITGYGSRKLVPGDRIKAQVRNAIVLLSFCSLSQAAQNFRISSVDLKKDYVDMKLEDGPRVSLAWNMDINDVEVQHRQIEKRLDTLRIVMRKAELTGVPLQTVDQTGDDPDYCVTTPRWDRRD